MTDDNQRYVVTVHELKDEPGALALAFVPNGAKQISELLPARPPRYLVVARTGDGKIAFDWEQTPDDPGEERATLEIEARHRVETRHEWIARVAAARGPSGSLGPGTRLADAAD